jgi:uncharacterized protein YueI
MKPKQILYLAIATVILLVVYVVSERGNIPTAETRYLVEIDTAKVTEMSYYFDGSTVTLDRRGSEWWINNPLEYRANPQFVNAALQKLTLFRIESEITSKKERWAEFDLNQDKAVHATIIHDGKTADFYLGKVAEGYKHTYARLEGDDTVYLIKDTYSTSLIKTADLWRDKRILAIEQWELLGIETNDYKITRTGEQEAAWLLNNTDGTVDTTLYSKTKNIQGSVSRLKTSDFPKEEDYANINWSKPSNVLKVTLSSGVFEEISFYKDLENEKRYYVRMKDNDTTFRIYEGAFNQIFKTVEEIMPAAAEG